MGSRSVWMSKVSLVAMLIPFFVRLSATGNVLLSSVILGVNLNGLGPGVMVRRNGRKSGSDFCLPSVTSSETMGNLSWNVRTSVVRLAQGRTNEDFFLW